MPRFLFHFTWRHFDFILPELKALCSLHDARAVFPEDIESFDPKESPFLVVELENSDVARKIAERMILLNSVVEIYGEGGSYEEVLAGALAAADSYMPLYEDGHRWKMSVDAFGRKYTHSEKLEIMARLKDVPLFKNGVVSIRDPQTVFCIIEDIGRHSRDDPPRYIYFGKQVGVGGRPLIDKYNVKKREYIGTTSMDAELSLIMANMGKARQGAFMLDPFGGTGSLLCVCAEFGCMTFGSDIDPRVLRGKVKKGRHVSVQTNFKQYGLSDLLGGLVVMDHNHSAWVPRFDLIVTDPPYGVRAGAKKVGTVGEAEPVKEEFKDCHYPKKVAYELDDVLADLIVFSARSLCLGGRVVFWLPTTPGFKPTDIPRHPCLEVLAYSEQGLSGKISRRLVTMEKTIEFSEEEHGSFVPAPTTPGGPAHKAFASKYLNKSLDGTGEESSTSDSQ